MSVKVALITGISLAILGTGFWLISSSNNQSNQQLSTNENIFEQTSINELLAQNKDLQCSYSTTDSQNTLSSGEVYLSDGRFRGDFNAKAEGETAVSSHMINDGQTQYAWQDGEADGFKFQLQQVDPDQTEDDSDSPTSVDRNEDFDFQCRQWSVDEERFQPPENINFVDYTQQIEETQNQSSEALERACSQIADSDQRAACESAL